MLETEQGMISDSIAIAKFLAHGHASLLGSSAEARASIDQWVFWFVTGAANDQKVAVNAMLGQKSVEQAAFTESMNKIKANAKILNA